RWRSTRAATAPTSSTRRPTRRSPRTATRRRSRWRRPSRSWTRRRRRGRGAGVERRRRHKRWSGGRQGRCYLRRRSAALAVARASVVFSAAPPAVAVSRPRGGAVPVRLGRSGVLPAGPHHRRAGLPPPGGEPRGRAVLVRGGLRRGRGAAPLPPPPTRLRRLPRRAAGGEHAPALDRLQPVAPRRRGVGAAVARPRAAGRAAAPGAARARPRPRARRPPLRADGDERRAVHASGPAGLRAVRRVRAGGAGTGPRVVPRAPRPRAARQAGAPVRVALHPPADGLRAVVARGARRAAWSRGAG